MPAQLPFPGSPAAAGNYSDNNRGMRIVIAGKGGVGKTTTTALLAHIFSRDGLRVLAVDGDPQQNLAVTLGISPDNARQIVPVSGSADYLREKTGAGPDISPGGLLTLNPDVSDVIDRFSIPVADNLRLLVMGGVRTAGTGCLCAEYTLLAAILRHIPLLPDQVVLLDTPAGMEHFGRAVADGFDTALIVSDPSWNAVSVARESADLARQMGIKKRILVVNRSPGRDDAGKFHEFCGKDELFSRVISLPVDPDVVRFEPVVTPLLDHQSPFREGMRCLAEDIRQCVQVHDVKQLQGVDDGLKGIGYF
ncbi:MAG: AAA family ATPase [Methanoregula sp.]|jgi:CO dehydrogenase maturation factor|nr:AAA family ATPase [Methanoregula sp.]